MPQTLVHLLYGTGRNGRKEGHFYLTMHSTHFYLQLYVIEHVVKDHSDK